MGTKKKTVAIMVAALYLTGCAMAGNKCQQYGYKPGTEAFDNCVSAKLDGLSKALIAAGNGEDSATGIAHPSIQPKRTVMCRDTNSGMECF